MNESTTPPGVGPTGTPASRNRDTSRVSHGLVALSSAAVLAIYSAGYVRTQAAAERLASETGRRRPVAPAPQSPEADADSAYREWSRSGTAADLGTRANGGGAAATRPVDDVLTPQPQHTERTGISVATTTGGATSAPAAAESVAVQPMARGNQPAPDTLASDISMVPPAASQPVADIAGDVSVPGAVAVPQPAREKYRDGRYRGWGTSRHGDIQAEVIIVNGRITSAIIAQCLTRWPCEVIATLPPQVAQRQSADVDFVSGATQSTNAFYNAVVEALGEALY